MLEFPTKARITFNERVINSNWNKMNRGPIAKAGNTVRKIAVRSIRMRKDPDAHAPLGHPPFSHDVGHSVPRFRMIYSVPDRFGTRAVVGMEGFGSPHPAPELQEYGGTAYRSFRYVEKIQRRDKRGRYRKSGKILRQYSGIVRIPERSFMRRALGVAIDRGYLPSFWNGALNRTARAA